jgi:hypothetical protein
MRKRIDCRQEISFDAPLLIFGFIRMLLYLNVFAQQWEAERQVEHLFQTLLHRAFGGEV